MKRTTLAIAAVAITTTAAHAGSLSYFEGTINGANGVPMTDSLATGTLSGVYDADANTFSFSWSITDNLTGIPAAPGAHIHDGFAGETGPVIFAFNNPDGSWALEGSDVWTDLTDAQVDDLFADGLYMNFHTTTSPAGEVRGQIALVPTPAGTTLIGVAGLAAVRRRRK